MLQRTERIASLDLLRGLCVFFACLQHYAGHLTVWYSTFFREASFVGTHYGVHADFVGRILPLSTTEQWVARLTVPWLSLFYIALAAFNLATRDKEAFRGALMRKLAAFAIVFALFVGEGLIASVNLGHGLTFSPLMAWMIILAIVSTVYALLGARGVTFLFALSMLRFVLPVESANREFEAWVQSWLHPHFRYDAELDLFLPAACLGFLWGYVFHQTPGRRRLLIQGQIALSVVTSSIYLFTGISAPSDPTNVYAHEHLARSFIPMVGVLGIHALCFALALSFQRWKWPLKTPFFTWMGVASLSVFFFHRIVFIHIYMPLREVAGNFLALPIENSMPEILLPTLFNAALVYAVHRSGALSKLQSA